MSHNPCFSGKLFAIDTTTSNDPPGISHNPCFSGKLFAIFFNK